MSTITVTGGAPSGSIETTLTQTEAQLASNVLNGDNVAYQSISIVSDGARPPAYVSPLPSYVVIGGSDSLTSTEMTKVTVAGINSIIIGDQDYDNMTMLANGTVVGGDGRNAVTIEGATGNSSVNLGDGNDSVNMSGNTTINVGNGNDQISVGTYYTASSGIGGVVNAGNGSDSIYLVEKTTVTAGNGNDYVNFSHDGALTIGSGNDTILGRGSDTIALNGFGNDSIYISGQATITGAFGAASINASGINNGLMTVQSLGTSQAVIASGMNVTLQGAAAGNEVLQFQTGNGVLSGGTGQNDTLIGGAGLSTMTGGGGNNLYEFNSTSPGGTAIINNFTQGSDQLQLNGYSVSTVLANDTVQSGGNTYINLGSGTTIELKGFTGTLQNSDFR